MSNNNKRISGLAGTGQPKSQIKNSLSVRSSEQHAPQLNESHNINTRSKRKFVDDETSGESPTNSESKRGPGRPETNNQPLNAGAVPCDGMGVD